MVGLCTSDNKSTTYAEWIGTLSDILLTLQRHLVDSVLGRIYEYSGDCIDCIMQHDGIKAVLEDDIPACPVCVKSQSVSKDSRVFVDRLFGTDTNERMIIDDYELTNNKAVIDYMLARKLIRITYTDDYDLINLTEYGQRTFVTKMMVL